MTHDNRTSTYSTQMMKEEARQSHAQAGRNRTSDLPIPERHRRREPGNQIYERNTGVQERPGEAYAHLDTKRLLRVAETRPDGARQDETRRTQDDEKR